MLTRDFDYQLPDEAIAQQPVPRGASRLLVFAAAGAGRHRTVRDLPALLRPGDLVVVNDTRVIPARLFGRAIEAPVVLPTEAPGRRIELLLVEKIDERTWDVLVKPGRRAPPGTRIRFEDGLEVTIGTATPGAGDGRRRATFAEPVEPHLERLGHVPLPPYIKRPDEAADRERYQTVFARAPGAIAAPTAGLHLSREILDELAERGIGVAPVTLHVGLGTFKPVTAELVHEHRMERERYEIPRATAAAIAATRAAGGRIVAVGTTVVRTLEGASAAAGDELPPAGSGTADLFILPGFRFRVVDVLMTNFHLPRSTLLMLVAAFAGREQVLAAYREAIAEGYRFYSYGDAMLVARGTTSL